MYYLFFSFLSLIFKWQRLIFVLISLEFLVMSLFLYFSSILTPMYFFYFLSFTVISSVLGMVMMVGCLKFFGTDKSIFYEFKLIKLLVFKTKNFCS